MKSELYTHLQTADELLQRAQFGEAERLAELILQTYIPQEKSIVEAIEHYESNRTYSEEETDIFCRAMLLYSETLWRQGNAQQGLIVAKKLLTLLHSFDQNSLLADTYFCMSCCYWFLTDYPQSLEYVLYAMEHYKSDNNDSDIGRCYSMMGNIYTVLSDYPQALFAYTQALAFAEKVGDKIFVSNCLGNIAILYNYLDEYALAIDYNLKTLTIVQELKDEYSMAKTYNNLAGLYQKKKEYAQALEYYYQALALNKKLNVLSSVANNLGNIGNLYKDLHDYEEAIEYCGQAVQLYTTLNDKRGQSYYLMSLGAIYTDLHNPLYDLSKGEYLLLQGLTITQEAGIKDDERKAHDILSEIYEQNNNWEKAHYHFKEFYKIEKELFSEEIKKKIEHFDYERKIAEQEKQIAIERAKGQVRLDEQQKLLHNVLPPMIADRLLRNETFIADSYPSVSVLFMDLVNFTRIAATVPPKHLIYVLNTIFSSADAVMEKYGLEKIKTIGDAYMAVAGAPITQSDHAHRASLASLELLDSMNNLSIKIPSELGATSWIESVGEISVRIGIHSGEAIGGVIGDKKFSFDLWGDAVNTASRMESHGEAGKIHVSEEFVRELRMRNEELGMKDKELTGDNSQFVIINSQFIFVPRGEMEIKGKGMMKTYFLEKLSEQGL
ncbi:MAG: tetratricopeptide repeat protein [Ignavibacteria bacterium]|nr:tetratricopeptide repeat protein [Ignavibacteria bacterium]